VRQPVVGPRIVINSKSEYEPEHLEKPYLFPGKIPNPQDAERRYLILSEHTFMELQDSLDWGRTTKRNRVEQGGVLLGRIAYYGNEIYCFVEDILLADTSGDPVFVEFTSEMWADMQNGLAKINASLDKKEQLVIVGWFHTHPNGLSVFMSGTDMTTQRLNFSQEWQVSLVMNPHTDKYGAFFGARATVGKVVLPESRGYSKH
jgi:proteasome lid subunit RPN8/RPN11